MLDFLIRLSFYFQDFVVSIWWSSIIQMVLQLSSMLLHSHHITISFVIHNCLFFQWLALSLTCSSLYYLPQLFDGIIDFRGHPTLIGVWVIFFFPKNFLADFTWFSATSSPPFLNLFGVFFSISSVYFPQSALVIFRLNLDLFLGHIGLC